MVADHGRGRVIMNGTHQTCPPPAGRPPLAAAGGRSGSGGPAGAGAGRAGCGPAAEVQQPIARRHAAGSMMQFAAARQLQ